MDIFISHKTALGMYFLAQSRGEGELYRLLRPLAGDPIHAGAHSERRDGMCAGTGEACCVMSPPIGVGDRNDMPQLTLASAASRARDMRGLDLGFLELLLPDTIDVLVPDKNRCHASPAIRQHVWSGPIPPGAFFKLAEHVYISSPEFVLLQMAAGLDRYQTLQLAMQLCGTFALQHGVEHDMVQHPQLTKKERLELFGQGVADRRIGMGNYRWAVRHVLSGAASTTESGIALLLSMPSNTGAFGLKAFQLNVEKRYGPIEREIAGGKDRCVVDLLDEETRFGWEYQGKEGHSDAEDGVPYGQASRMPGTAESDSAGSSAQDLDFTLSYGAERLDADTRKLAALAHMKYDVRALVWGQIKTVRDFTHVARATAEAFGIAPDELYAFSEDPRLLERRKRLHRGLILRRYYWQDV